MEGEDGTNGGMARRGFLKAAVAAPLTGLAAGTEAAEAKGGGQTPPGLIVRARTPDNLETPFSSLSGYVTPTPQFYIRSHYAVPDIDAQVWRLRVAGAVEHTLELSLDELARMPQKTLAATIECAGNSRVFLQPATTGVQWEQGAVGTAEWTGVPLAEVLKRAGLRPNAVDVVLEGADKGEIRNPPRPAGQIPFARSLSAAKAQDPDVLLALRMNGEPLTPPHGAPLRAVVPGWYGMASIKWLSRLIATERPFDGYYQTIDYAYWEEQNGLPTRVPITAMQLKASIARPAMQETVSAGKLYRVYGAAWAGEGEVAKVEVSGDGGRAWAAARFLDPPRRYCWRRWEYDWRAPAAPGRVSVMARATDTRGSVQPMERSGNRENYMISHVIPVDVWVR